MKLHDKIVEIMKTTSRARDDWHYLLATVWRSEYGPEKAHEDKAVDLLRAIASGKLTSAETVSRCWRKILEEIPELRGPEYNKRHSIIQKKVKEYVKEVGEDIKVQQNLKL